MIRAYWSRSDNFGDRLTVELLSRFGIDVKFAKPAHADLFAVGSIVDYIPDGYGGVVLGAGVMRPTCRADLSRADVRALRGPITAAQTGVDTPLFGDLGLLCRLFAPKLSGAVDVGVIPHFRDPGLIRQMSRKGNLPIDLCAGFDHVIGQTARCRRIVTSSLHGLILADSLGLEAQWVRSPHVYGGGLKFDDYNRSIGVTLDPGVWRTADPTVIGEKIVRLTAEIGRLS